MRSPSADHAGFVSWPPVRIVDVFPSGPVRWSAPPSRSLHDVHASVVPSGAHAGAIPQT